METDRTRLEYIHTVKAISSAPRLTQVFFAKIFSLGPGPGPGTGKVSGRVYLGTVAPTLWSVVSVYKNCRR